jgi:putative DNA methylase
MITRKKLIEVALPLEKINLASAREKSIRHGHPSTLHLWWARRPLAAARAVIFAQMVDDPSEYVAELRRDPVAYVQAQRTLMEQMAAWTIRRRSFEATPVAGERAVRDPGQAPTLEECLADNERQRLFRLIEQLVLWENTTNEDILQQARDEIGKSWRRTCADNHDHPRAAELFNPEKLPAFHDPFAGGGALPLEAQRLGLESYASDLNPVAVLINKAMIEIPPKFSGRPPVNPDLRFEIFDVRLEGKQSKIQNPKSQITWKGAAGLAADVRYYGQWMRDEAEKRIGHLYPKVQAVRNPDGSYRHATQEEIQNPKSQIENLTVIAWLWARTVNSPNPAFAHVAVPLASTFMLSTKPGKETYVEPVIEGDSYRFTVKVGKPKDAEAAKNGTKLSRGANFRCLLSETPIAGDYIKAEGVAGRMGARLMAIVAEGERGRIYLAPTLEHEAIAKQAQPEWVPETPIAPDKRSMFTPLYGMTHFNHLFTPRQLVALNTFSDLAQAARERVKVVALAAALADDVRSLDTGGTGATAYADAVAVYLAFAVDKSSMFWSSLCYWLNQPKNEIVANTFGRQALPMVWDYAESNPFSDSGGNFDKQVEHLSKAIAASLFGQAHSTAIQFDAAQQILSVDKVISTDPPYYDNIGYADLSDFFYVWLRRILRTVFPDLFDTLAVPKAEELVATPYRHGGKEQAEKFFLDGMTHAMQRLADQAHPAFPVTIYYAFKQAETDRDDGTSNTGWETFLDAVIRAGFAISGTWPVRTERPSALKNISNALASSIVLVCRPRPANAPTVTRRDFLAALKDELPVALANMQRGNIAPVDLAQASIGPGMGVFTRYGKVIDATGKALTVREALTLINQSLDEVLAEQEGDFDSDTRWALAWFDQYGFAEGEYGVAETLSKAKNTSVAGMVTAGILASGAGKVRLLRPEELPANWNPDDDARLTVWEMVHHLVRALSVGNEASESAAGKLLAQLGARADIARELAYRLYALCERKKRAAEALAYNGLVQSWPEMLTLAQAQRRDAPVQLGF